MEIIPREYFIHKKGKELEDFVNVIFNHLRSEGYPYYPTNKEWRRKEFEALMLYDDSNIIKNGVIERTTHGITLAWSYFPHSVGVRCGNMKTPLEAFNNDDHLKMVIRNIMKLGSNISDTSIRTGLRIVGTQAVSNFRCTAASAIYKMYGGERPVIWDMSGGWGGRMLGAIKANAKFYYATEPSTLTHKGLIELGNDFFPKKQFEIIKKGSEVWRPDKNSLDICFTSPPYFDVEKYSDEPTQSFKKFDSREGWVNGFMLKTLENCYYGLKKGKYCLINIADPKHKKGLSIERLMPKLGEQAGFKFTNLINLELAAMPGSGSSNFKTEPVFVFKKI